MRRAGCNDDLQRSGGRTCYVISASGFSALGTCGRGLSCGRIEPRSEVSERLAEAEAYGSARERDRATPRGSSPAVTILKPLRGLEPGLEENLASFCDQDYPAFQIVFSATDADDPALAVARRVVDRFPQIDAEIVIAPGNPQIANPKIANVANAFARAKHPIVVMSDADMHVDSGYLRAITAEFSDPEVGAVTCRPAGGVPEGGLASTIAAMFINDHFAPSVLVAGALESPRYTFGSTMAVRREVLEAIGGMSALGATIADDARLGELVSAAGLRVALAQYVVANLQESCSLADVWEREVRWARTIRFVRPAGSTMAVVTYALPVAFFAWLTQAALGPPSLGLRCRDGVAASASQRGSRSVRADCDRDSASRSAARPHGACRLGGISWGEAPFGGRAPISNSGSKLPSDTCSIRP